MHVAAGVAHIIGADSPNHIESVVRLLLVVFEPFPSEQPLRDRSNPAGRREIDDEVARVDVLRGIGVDEEVGERRRRVSDVGGLRNERRRITAR